MIERFGRSGNIHLLQVCTTYHFYFLGMVAYQLRLTRRQRSETPEPFYASSWDTIFRQTTPFHMRWQCGSLDIDIEYV